MKIAVCMKQVPAASEGNMDPETGVLIRAGLQAIVNVYDLAALEAALKIKETYGAEVHVFTMRPQTPYQHSRCPLLLASDRARRSLSAPSPVLPRMILL